MGNRLWSSILVLFGLVYLAGTSAAQELVFKKVAVFPFSVMSKEPLEHLGGKIQATIQDYLLKEGFNLVSSEDLNRELAQLREPLTNARAVELGRKLGADLVISGSMIKIGPTLALKAQLTDLTGKITPATLTAESVGLGTLDQLSTKLAQEASFKILGQERIFRIEVKGNRRVEKDAILAIIQSREGDLISPAKLRDDLKAVYKLGYFTDVKIDVSDSPEGQIVTFVVDEKPAIREIFIEGNRKIKDKKIMEALDIKLYSVASDAAILENIDKVKGIYREKGYYEAQVKYRLEPISKEEVNLVLEIEEGPKLYIDEISFEGNRAFKDKKLRKLMETKEKSLLTFITGAGILNRDTLERDAEKIAAFYYNHGYIKARVGEPRIDIQRNKINITIPIEEGAQYKVGQVDFQGDLLEPPEKLKELLSITKEDIYSREVIQTDLTNLGDFYADHGYANANIAPLLKENDLDLTVDVIFDIHKGEKIYFERIEISGNTRTRDKVIRRELRVYEQELFSATNIKRSIQNLRRLEFFEDVNFSTSPGSSADKMNLKIAIKERPTGTFGIGAGYSTQDRVVGMIEISQANLFGRGQKLKAQGLLGAISHRFRLSFEEPYLLDRPLSLGLDAYNWEREYDEYIRKSKGGNIQLSHPMRWEYTRLYGMYRYENVNLRDLDPYASQVLLEAATIHNTSAVSMTFRRDSRDALFNTTRGSDNSISIELAGLGGDVAYTRYVGESGWYFPLFWNTVGLIHGRIGYLQRNPWGKLPSYEKFYLGGIDTIRGFKYAEISPRDPITNERIGGEKFVQFNTEYRFPLYKKLGLIGLVFFDAGNVYANNVEYFSSMRTSVGTGIRWYSPMGPLRVEWGYNIRPKPWESHSNWEFSVGGVF
ncbi:MAG: outer membrane protein assembly factor BamA [Deltaproteobacteria bacterium]|nr:outer membrane protein assembly factor BamA [Deltaproteobacteria bacterium]MBW1952507.1 outer membrane protein assembly factor BamA [Deltaproteobacteria bacterium]MBW1987268.1 outer membrane protein assembly factor BamA [Deltaproteobacteria bacterium]MBW2135126.1 outer membrane protein assembly factor BamA [Deltaproteobacteria bacterium]